MPCQDCYDKCSPAISDKCVKYTGPDIPALNIKTGDTLSFLEDKALNALLTALDGTGIKLEHLDLASAPWVKEQLQWKESSLYNILQILIESVEYLKEKTEQTSEQYVFNTSCLSGLPANPSPNDILAAAIVEICQQKNTLTQIQDEYVKQAELPNLVQDIINETNPNAGILQYKDRAIPYVAYPYYGSLSNFDNTGKGILAAGFDQMYICNGANGTPDKRGRVGVGATRNVPGPVLDGAVNPSGAFNSTDNVDYTLGDKFGENFHALSTEELVPHTHGVVDPGHSHGIPTSINDKNSGKASVGNGGNEGPLNTDVKKTNITIASAGGGKRFNVRQPSIAELYIMYIPQ